jgi:hypothetical protein
MTPSFKLAAMMASLLFAPSGHAQTRQTNSFPATHGTVNVILANGGSLVMVTDSMLSTGPLREPTGVKLYKIDDRTICSMAGLYKQPGPDVHGGFNALIPNTIATFVARNKKGIATPFKDKVEEVSEVVQLELTAHLQAVVAADRRFNIADPSYRLYLTMAGYDVDDAIRVADITLEPQRTHSGVSYVSIEKPRTPNPPLCELASRVEQLPPPGPEGGEIGPAIHTVEKALFCDIAGLRNVAETMLAGPANYPEDLDLQLIVQARNGRELSAADLRKVAIDLAHKTEVDETNSGNFRVGGPPQIAILSGGRLLESPTMPLPPPTQDLLSESQIRGESIFNCDSPMALSITGLFSQMEAQVRMTGCSQAIDGLLFHDSTFIDSHLSYRGKEPLIFADTNVVTRTTLDISPRVDISKPAVRHLICGFLWARVSQGDTDLKPSCAVR